VVLDRRPPSSAAAPRLDPDQSRVVAHGSGPLLVLAGPGTGKTTTLVEAMVARLGGPVLTSGAPSQPPPGKPRTWLAPAVVATAVALGGGWLGVTRTTEVPRTPVLLPLPGPPEVPTTVIDAGTQEAPVEAPDAGPSAPLDAGRPATDAGRPRGKSSPLITDSPFGGP
jgi:hypothetical protein